MDFFEIMLQQKLAGGGGDEPVLIDKTISANGTYNASSDNADGYKKVVANVPEPSGTVNITQNGTVDVSQYASADVNVSGGSLEYGQATQKLTTPSTIIEFSNIPAEPKLIALATACSMNSTDSTNYIASYAKFGNETLIKRYKPSTGDYADTGITITATFENNKLRLTSSSMNFQSIQGYTLIYAY